MAVQTDSAPAPKFHRFIITGRSSDFPPGGAQRLALYAAGALCSTPSRQAVEDLIQALIGILDEIDGCPDLESGGDAEPWLGSREQWTEDQFAWGSGEHDDREWGASDLEPNLGSIERGAGSQTGWAMSGDDDREFEPQRLEGRFSTPNAAIPTISAADCIVVEVRR